MNFGMNQCIMMAWFGAYFHGQKQTRGVVGILIKPLWVGPTLALQHILTLGPDHAGCWDQAAAALPAGVAAPAACIHQGAGTEGRGRGRGRLGAALRHGVVVVAGHSSLHRGRGCRHWSSLLLVSKQWKSSGGNISHFCLIF